MNLPPLLTFNYGRDTLRFTELTVTRPSETFQNPTSGPPRRSQLSATPLPGPPRST
jgi:hypothetical protein